MEGSMDKNGSKLSDESELPTELKLENTVNTSGERNVVRSSGAIRCSGCWDHNLSRRQ